MDIILVKYISGYVEVEKHAIKNNPGVTGSNALYTKENVNMQQLYTANSN